MSNKPIPFLLSLWAAVFAAAFFCCGKRLFRCAAFKLGSPRGGSQGRTKTDRCCVMNQSALQGFAQRSRPRLSGRAVGETTPHPLALPLGELSAQPTERVCPPHHRITQCTANRCIALSVSRSGCQLPQRGSQGRTKTDRRCVMNQSALQRFAQRSRRRKRTAANFPQPVGLFFLFYL